MVASIHNALTWEFVVNAFLDHGTSPSLLQALGNQPQWFRAIISTVFSLGILMTDCLNVRFLFLVDPGFLNKLLAFVDRYGGAGLYGIDHGW